MTLHCPSISPTLSHWLHSHSHHSALSRASQPTDCQLAGTGCVCWAGSGPLLLPVTGRHVRGEDSWWPGVVFSFWRGTVWPHGLPPPGTRGAAPRHPKKPASECRGEPGQSPRLPGWWCSRGAEEDHNKSRPSHLDTPQPPLHFGSPELLWVCNQWCSVCSAEANIEIRIESEYYSASAWSVFK